MAVNTKVSYPSLGLLRSFWHVESLDKATYILPVSGSSWYNWKWFKQKNKSFVFLSHHNNYKKKWKRQQQCDVSVSIAEVTLMEKGSCFHYYFFPSHSHSSFVTRTDVCVWKTNQQRRTPPNGCINNSPPLQICGFHYANFILFAAMCAQCSWKDQK